ncbi:hypothetical protein T484DRAFT_2923481 [Baffinella frigidus]|nr:hypothetical protein T484DRAFT_2923481 [Cryptophyta sp. CCMP2293]
MIAPMISLATPALSSLFAARSLTAAKIDKNDAQSAGDLPPNDWGAEKAHTRDPTPTTIDASDPKSKQTHIPEGESFAEYLARRNGGAAPSAPAAPAAPAYSAPAAAAPSWSAPAAQRSSSMKYEMGKGYNPAARGGSSSGYQPAQGYTPAAAADSAPAASRNEAAAGMFADYMSKRGGGAAAPAEAAAPVAAASRNEAAAGMFAEYMAKRK